MDKMLVPNGAFIERFHCMSRVVQSVSYVQGVKRQMMCPGGSIAWYDCVHGEVMLLICCLRGELKSVHPQGVNVGSPVLGSPVLGSLGPGTERKRLTPDTLSKFGGRLINVSLVSRPHFSRPPE